MNLSPTRTLPPTPTGNRLRCKGWVQEAAYRMLLNNLDPAVAERPEDLVVYGGTGKAARNHEALALILKTLQNLANDETLLIQSGKAVGVLRTHADAPRVLIANSLLVPHWANWPYFRELEAKGLIMYGQMTAGSWIYIGSQGIVQGTFETFAEVARQHFGGSLRGTLSITAGLGGMGGAQPLAITMNGGVCLVAEVEPWRIQKRLDTKYLDVAAESLQAGITLALEAKASGKAISIAVACNAVELLQALQNQHLIPDILTDQTSAHDPLVGYFPVGMSVQEAKALRETDADAYTQRSLATIAQHMRLMLALQARGAITFDYGNNLRGQALTQGVEDAFTVPGFVPAYIRPLFCRGIGPFRWVALSGEPEDIYRTDEKIRQLFPHNAGLQRWLTLVRERIAFQGLPARICWLGMGERKLAGLAFNEMVRTGELKAPIVIGRDHLDAGSVASPNRETEAMLDGSDAIADWPVLNALVNTASGASWVSLHHGGGVGIGYSIHAGQVIVADGTPEAALRLARVLDNDPAMGVLRHLDAGYPLAQEAATEHGLDAFLKG